MGIVFQPNQTLQTNQTLSLWGIEVERVLGRLSCNHKFCAK